MFLVTIVLVDVTGTAGTETTITRETTAEDTEGQDGTRTMVPIAVAVAIAIDSELSYVDFFCCLLFSFFLINSGVRNNNCLS